VILPQDDECRETIETLAQDLEQLTDWERSFVESNLTRHNFTPLQREQIARLLKKYDL